MEQASNDGTCAGEARQTAERFKIGDVVSLKSGGASMTVVGVGCVDVTCQWMTAEGSLDEHDFHRDMIVHDQGIPF